ncbi:MAG: hypothetical protein JRE36_15815 [Deltaproteobacteria bacterium]|nr:hypothetical protein [Deltaproteobacteria bacterium]
MNYGYTGRILHVDLTNRDIDIEDRDEAFFRSYLGGRGVGYHYLMKMVAPRIDPLSPDNILVLATGVMTGSPLAAIPSGGLLPICSCRKISAYRYCGRVGSGRIFWTGAQKGRF